MDIYLARHGQDEDNLNGILNGQRNMPLTSLGEKQAQELAKAVKEHNLHFDVVLSSPLKRAFETAKVISNGTGQPQPLKEDLLIERDFGVMTGVETSEIEELCAPKIMKTKTVTYFLSPEGAETNPDQNSRGKKLLSKIEKEYKDKKILLVSHGDIGKSIYAAFYDLPWEDVLRNFHFGNTELLHLSESSPPEDTHIFSTDQHNL